MPWRNRWWLLVATVLTRLPGLVRTPLSDDEAIYTIIGRALRDGDTLYRDIADHKPPALYMLYTAAEWVSGTWALLLVHLATALVVWGTALSLAAIVRVLRPAGSANAATWTALAYIAFTTTMMPFDGLAANAELWMLLPTVWAVRLVLTQLHETPSPYGTPATHHAPSLPVSMRAQREALAGVLAGCAILFKVQAITVLPVLGIALVLQGGPFRHIVRSVLMLAAGTLLPFALWWLHARFLGDATETAFWLLFNFRYTSAGVTTPDLMVRTVLRVGFALAPAAALYVWGARGLWRLLRQWDRIMLIMLLWVLTAGAAVALGGRWFGHYFHQLTAPMAVLLGVATADGVRARWLAVTTAIPVVGFWLVAWNTPRVMRAIGDPIPDYAAIVESLDRIAPRATSVCVWGNAPLLLELARRPMGCRFVSAHFLTGASPATAAQRDATLADQQIVPGMWERFVADLDVRQPILLVDLSPGDVAHWGAFPPSRYPALATRLATSYAPVDTVAGAVIYRRR